jgi:hypothetical protein
MTYERHKAEKAMPDEARKSNARKASALGVKSITIAALKNVISLGA